MRVLIICLGHRWLEENHVINANFFKAVKIQNIIVVGKNLFLSVITEIGPSCYIFIFWKICDKSRSQTPVNSVIICRRRFSH